MKVFAISDLHLGTNENKPMDIFGSVWDNHWEKISADWDARVSDEDIVLVAGDISWSLNLEGAIDDISLIGQRKGMKILIKGNHDYWWSSISKIRDLLPQGIMAIQNDAIKIGEYVICGTRCWNVPELEQVADADDVKLYERERQRLELSLKAADKLREPDDKLIVMTHFPPFNSRFEDSAYTKLIAEYNADIAIYGHLHGVQSRSKPIVDKGGIPYFLTSCDKLDNKLLELF